MKQVGSRMGQEAAQVPPEVPVRQTAVSGEESCTKNACWMCRKCSQESCRMRGGCSRDA